MSREFTELLFLATAPDGSAASNTHLVHVTTPEKYCVLPEKRLSKM
jgi:hypothetical protein